MNDYEVSPLADADLKSIWDYIATDAPESAAAFHSELVAKFELIADHPYVGRARDDVKRGLRSIPAGAYVVYYLVVKGGVRIHRVLHGARDTSALL